MKYKFEWNQKKAKSNRIKHGVSFEEAQSVFDDPLAGIIDDPAHSLGENRFLIVGMSKNFRLLVISFTERGESIRIISCRKSTTKERKSYEENYL
ncbi:MAG: BrnT family toxin [Bacteroidetes bacterium]|nr:BrnT family toxin [Bacteroidota bacterium]MBU2585083.1 BrnT family toxin [Bacteroidota bacterium]